MVPLTCHVKHAIEKPVIYIANVADGDLVVKTLHRFWFPQRIPVIQRGELMSVNVIGLVLRHEKKEYWWAKPSAGARYNLKEGILA
jgi:hypothetical protein